MASRSSPLDARRVRIVLELAAVLGPRLLLYQLSTLRAAVPTGGRT